MSHTRAPELEPPASPSLSRPPVPLMSHELEASPTARLLDVHGGGPARRSSLAQAPGGVYTLGAWTVEPGLATKAARAAMLQVTADAIALLEPAGEGASGSPGPAFFTLPMSWVVNAWPTPGAEGSSLTIVAYMPRLKSTWLGLGPSVPDASGMLNRVELRLRAAGASSSATPRSRDVAGASAPRLEALPSQEEGSFVAEAATVIAYLAHGAPVPSPAAVDSFPLSSQAAPQAAWAHPAAGSPFPVRRLKVFVNPVSGPGHGVSIWKGSCADLLADAGCLCDVTVTSRAEEATDVLSHMPAAELLSLCGVVGVGGDGILYEILQGCLDRPDWKTVVNNVRLGLLPAGSGNGLVCSLVAAAGLKYSASAAALLIAKDMSTPMDVASTFIAPEGVAPPTPRALAAAPDLWPGLSGHSKDGGSSVPVAHDDIEAAAGASSSSASSSSPSSADPATWGKRRFQFLSTSWAIVSDIDIESQALRCCGAARFDVCGAVRAVCLRRYAGRLYFLPPPPPGEGEASGVAAVGHTASAAGGSPSTASGVASASLTASSTRRRASTGNAGAGVGEEAADAAGSGIGAGGWLPSVGEDYTPSPSPAYAASAVAAGCSHPEPDLSIHHLVPFTEAVPDPVLLPPPAPSRARAASAGVAAAKDSSACLLEAGSEEGSVSGRGGSGHSPSSPGWRVIEGLFTLLWITNTTHQSIGVAVSPNAYHDDGTMAITLMRDVSPAAMVGVLLDLGESQPGIAAHPGVEVHRCVAFRLEPAAGLKRLGKRAVRAAAGQGHIALDGEDIKPYGAVQAEVHRGLVKIFGPRVATKGQP